MSKLYHKDTSAASNTQAIRQLQSTTVVPDNQPVNFHGDTDAMPWGAITTAIIFWLVIGVLLIKFILWLGKKYPSH